MVIKDEMILNFHLIKTHHVSHLYFLRVSFLRDDGSRSTQRKILLLSTRHGPESPREKTRGGFIFSLPFDTSAPIQLAPIYGTSTR